MEDFVSKFWLQFDGLLIEILMLIGILKLTLMILNEWLTVFLSVLQGPRLQFQSGGANPWIRHNFMENVFDIDERRTLDEFSVQDWQKIIFMNFWMNFYLLLS